MEAYQQRVIDEKRELDTRIAALGSFLTSAVSTGLPNEEQGRLTRQYEVMSEYARILGERIAAFPRC